MWGELSLGEFVMGGVAFEASCPGEPNNLFRLDQVTSQYTVPDMDKVMQERSQQVILLMCPIQHLFPSFHLFLANFLCGQVRLLNKWLLMFGCEIEIQFLVKQK